MVKPAAVVIAALLLGGLTSAPAAPAATEPVGVWLTTGDRSRLLAQQPSLQFGADRRDGLVIDVNEQHRYQEMDGFGAAMTDSSAWLIENAVPDAQRDGLMRKLFSTSDGIGMSYVRVPIGSSDHALSHYTYDDTCCDLSDFSLARDASHVIPALQQAKALNPDLKLMGSAWSPPAWMKSPARLNGGRLNAEHADEYADYLARFVSGYREQGLPISGVAIQNEPQSVPHDYPGMWMTAADQAAFAAQHLGPALAGTGTKIFALDHNWALAHYGVDVLDDPAARQYVDGTAFHCYGGSPEQQSIVRNAHPDKEILFTECASGGWATDWADNLVWDGVNLLVGTTRNWARTALKWNIALDRDGGPHTGGCTNCAGIVTIDRSSGAVTYNHDYYSIGHASKFVRPGAQRIASSAPRAGLHTVAFRNPDGTKALIAVNANESDQSFTVRWGGQSFQYTLPRESIATFTWNGTQDVAGAPEAPDALVADASDGRVALTWGFSASADSYTVRRAPAAGGAYSTVATGVTLPEYVDTGVVNGTAYKYVVSATNRHGSSPDSAPVSATPNPPRLRSAAATIEAESFDDQSGMAVQGCSDGSGCGESIGYTDDGDYLAWHRVHFGDGAESVSLRVASHSSGGDVELRLDGPNGPLVGTARIGGTGGWDNWTTVTAPITGASGIHSLYLVFRGDPPETAVSGIANLNWIRFVAPGAPADPGGPLSRAGWSVTASPSSGSEGNAIDGNPASRWTSGTGQADGHWFRVDMGLPRTFDRILIDSGTGNDFARGYRVEASSDAIAWTTLATGSGSGQTLDIPLGVSTARYLRLVQTGSAANWWSIHELDVFAPAGPVNPDLTPPDTSIDAGPSGTTDAGSATFEFSSSEPGSTFACSLDGGAFAPCSSPHQRLGLGNGEHRFEVRAVDAAGNVDDSPAVRTWLVEGVAADCGAEQTLAPVADAWFDQASTSDNKGSDSVLKVMSKGPVNNLRAAVRFAQPAAPSGCAVALATLRLYAGSARSGRTIEVLRLAGGWTESGVTWSTQPPTAGPAVSTPSGTGYREWDVTAQVRAMYETGAHHGFLVRDAAEGGDAEQQFNSREKGENRPQLLLSFAEPGADSDPPETTIGAKPPGLTREADASFGFSADEEGASFECTLDGGAWGACSSPASYAALTAGTHTFSVRATDAAGNVDETPAAHTWTVDDVAPETTITGVAGDSVSFTGSDQPAGGGALSFSCSLDGAAFAPCASPAAVGGLPPGEHELAVRATDPAGNTDATPARHSWAVAAPLPGLPTSQAPQGTWTGSFGAGGYALGAWNGTSDLVALPAGARLVVEQGGRTRWSSSTTSVRALQGPGGTGRRAAAWSHASEVRLRIDFAAAWSGDLNLYALDWDNRGRRQTVSVDDGSGPRAAVLDRDFGAGLWTRAPVDVPSGGSVRITVSRSAGTSAVLSGLFLGGAAPRLATSQAPQGTWTGSYGAGGYALGAWNSSTSDLVALPAGARLVVEQGGRTRWSSSTTSVRALQGPGGTGRRAAAWSHTGELRLRVDFTAVWSGDLHLYALDWDNRGRRQTVTVDDGSGPRVAVLDADFGQGHWTHAPVDVAAGGSVRITASHSAGTSAVLSGLFLGGRP